ncbi:MAG: type II toxin-antitoxin system RelB/DinJ family antitoxin [Bacilli bacterium]|nr:type II toxin-antitoxin system RelB/DinJ family antitoxin [Bacilli bacterium]
MSSISKQANLNIRLDSNLKKEAEILFKNLGLNMSSAINVFLTQSVKEQRIPFEICERKPSRKLKKALKEAEKIAKDPNVKSYNDVDEMFKDILD